MTHEKFMELRENPVLTHAWDFIFSEGDTIKEKYMSLYEMIQTCVLRKNGSPKKAFAVGNKHIISGITVSCSFNMRETTFTPIYKEVSDGVVLIADIQRSCGSNGYHTSFEAYEDILYPMDEVLVVNGDACKVIKLFNFIY